MGEIKFSCKIYSFFLGGFARKSYLCNVFFIVLDLRLTRLGYSGIPFFFAHKSKKTLDISGFLIQKIESFPYIFPRSSWMIHQE